MRNATSPFTSNRFLHQALVGLAFLGLVAVVSLPAARGAGPIGWMPMWLLGMPLAGLAALALADVRSRAPAMRAAATPSAATRRRVRPAQARRRSAPRSATARRQPGSPAAA